MKLSEYKNDYYEFTGKLSDINRNIAFAAIAIIWIFKQTAEGGAIVIPKDFIFPSILIVCALGFDLLQYIYQSATWSLFYHRNEKKATEDNPDPDILAPDYLNYPSWFLFVFKVFFVIWAYSIIFSYLYKTLFLNNI